MTAHQQHPKYIAVNTDPFLTIRQAAEYLNVSRSAMYEIIKREGLETVRFTSALQIRCSVLERFAASRVACIGDGA